MLPSRAIKKENGPRFRPEHPAGMPAVAMKREGDVRGNSQAGRARVHAAAGSATSMSWRVTVLLLCSVSAINAFSPWMPCGAGARGLAVSGCGQGQIKQHGPRLRGAARVVASSSGTSIFGAKVTADEPPKQHPNIDVWRMGDVPAADKKGSSKRGSRGKRSGGGRRGSGLKREPRPLTGVWRVFNVEIPVTEDAGKDSVDLSPALVSALRSKLGLEDGSVDDSSVRIVRKSFDARRVRRTGPQEPHFNYVVDVDFGPTGRVVRKLKAEAGKLERPSDDTFALDGGLAAPLSSRPTPVAIVGSGPAGLFAALHLAEAGVPCVVFERGQPVEERGRDIGAMLHR